VPVALYKLARRAPSDLEEITKPSFQLRDSLLEERTVESKATPASIEKTAKLGIHQAETVPALRWLSEAVTYKLPAVIPRRRKKRKRTSQQDELAMTAAKSSLAGLAVASAVALSVFFVVLLVLL
jgi:hypothetical protein